MLLWFYELETENPKFEKSFSNNWKLFLPNALLIFYMLSLILAILYIYY